MPILSKAVATRAVRNVARWGDTDVFPFPIENIVLFDSENKVADLLVETSLRFDDFINTQPAVNYSTLAAVGYNGYRWVTQIDPRWNAYLLALVLEVAPALEAARVPESRECVYSYRLDQSGADDGLFMRDGWMRFQERTRQLTSANSYVVSLDIADFYARIYHHKLENALRRSDQGGNITRQIVKLLSLFSGGTSYGLPVGGPAARILAEAVLNNVDHLLLADPDLAVFCRYADDYRFFVSDIAQAHRVVARLSEILLRNEGLTLQKTKTRIMTAREYASALDPLAPDKGTAAAFLRLHVHFDPYSATSVNDYERLKGQLSEFDVVGLLRSELTKGRIHAALVRRLVSAIQYMEPDVQEQALMSLLENLERLTPVVPQVMLAIRRCLEDLPDAFGERVHASLRNLIDEGHYLTQVDLNLAFMIRVLAGRQTIENEQLLIRLFAGPHGHATAPAPNIQRDIMLILARWNVSYWLSNQKNYIGSAHPWVQRGFLIASYQLGDEGDHWRKAASKRMSEFDLIVRDWVSQRAQITSWSIPI